MAQKVCWKCKSAVDEADIFCRACGQDLSGRIPWYYQPVWIAVLTVTALGPFSLWLIWRSPKLSNAGRWVATALILLFTFYLFAEAVKIYRELPRLLATFG